MTQQKRSLSLRKHITVILIVKLIIIVSIRIIFFPSLEHQHQPSDLYYDQELPSQAAKETL